MMQYNRVGQTDILLSAVGFGTCQLQMVPERQAIETLKRGFELGVNWVHTSFDYGGAEGLIAKAMDESRKPLKVLTQFAGDTGDFEKYFEKTCDRFGNGRLAMFGINCIDDAEFLGQNVWDSGGMVEFLLKKKKEGRIGALFCSTHGPPDYVARLIKAGCFDAILLSYNPLGFHVLTYHAAAEGKLFENIEQNREEIFPLAMKHHVSLLIMKPLAGGLLCRGKAFPPFERLSKERTEIPASDLLKAILREPAVCAVVPGTASVEEAEENARAGHQPLEISKERLRMIDEAVKEMKNTLCGRCGECEPTCSRSLPISWMFRDAYIWNHRSESFMALDRLSYFHIHQEDTLACITCTDRTCRCARGIDIPVNLARIHGRMLILRERGLLPAPPDRLADRTISGKYAAIVASVEVPDSLEGGSHGWGRFWIQNAGHRKWHAFDDRNGSGAIALGIFIQDKLIQKVPLRETVKPGARAHIAFEIQAPKAKGTYWFRFFLMPYSQKGLSKEITLIHSSKLIVVNSAGPSALDAMKTLRRIDRGSLGKVARRLLGNRAVWIASKMRRVGAFRSILGDASSHRSQGPPTAPEIQDVEETPLYGVRYIDHNIPNRLKAGTIYGARLTLENTGSLTWRSNPPEGNSVDLVVRSNIKLLSTHELPRPEIAPGERITIHFPLKVRFQAGRHTLRLELVEQKVDLFVDRGVPPLTLKVTVEPGPATRSDKIYQLSSRINPWHYQPTRGIQRSADGRCYPLFASRAKGSRLWDTEGNEYIDYVMGWGSTLLGYADDRVRKAIMEVLDTGAVTTLPHPIEMELSRMLIEDFPGAEMVVFGKNGSDVCTVAARLARAYTDKQTILYCGYHGWQDFWVEQIGFAGTDIPERPRRLIHRFKFNDLDDFSRLYEMHKDDLAAVMIEPSGPWAGNDEGPEPDVDPAFLHALSRATRKAGALLVFDEIVTGYRYPKGSVQKAKGVVPDLTCLGKALASGMPLSALVGPAHIFQRSLHKTHYGPTFKSEIYSMAAAKAAIRIYREEPVAEYVWNYGEKLRKGIHAICARLGIRAECKGPPFRMALIFQEQDVQRLHMKQALYHQELLKEGVTTYNGVMLPSYAHDELALERTLSAMGNALEVVAVADRKNEIDRYLEIPPLLF